MKSWSRGKTYIFEGIKVGNLVVRSINISWVDVVSEEKRPQVVVCNLLSDLSQMGKGLTKVLLEFIRNDTLAEGN